MGKCVLMSFFAILLALLCLLLLFLFLPYSAVLLCCHLRIPCYSGISVGLDLPEIESE